MPSASLQRLWKLHEIDTALVEIRKRAAALDPGRRIQSEIKELETELADRGGHAKSLSAEQTDLELANKGLDDKLKKFDKELYGGKVVNPREVEAIEKEIQILKKQRSKNDERILELWDLVPPAKESAKEVESRLEKKKAELAEYQKRLMQEKTRLETEFKRIGASRSEVAKDLEAGTLARYDAIRNRQGGIGMSRITKQGTCEQCGMNLPVKSIELAKDDRVVTCEACYRILYYSEGLV